MLIFNGKGDGEREKADHDHQGKVLTYLSSLESRARHAASTKRS
jgi:hypothetical protein